MKKVLFAVALVMGLGSSVAFANNMASDVEIVAMVNEFKPIDIKELPQAVQDAIKKDYAESTIKEAAVEVAEDGVKTYKVTLVDAVGTESVVFFNENESKTQPNVCSKDTKTERLTFRNWQRPVNFISFPTFTDSLLSLPKAGFLKSVVAKVAIWYPLPASAAGLQALIYPKTASGKPASSSRKKDCPLLS